MAPGPAELQEPRREAPLANSPPYRPLPTLYLRESSPWQDARDRGSPPPHRSRPSRISSHTRPRTAGQGSRLTERPRHGKHPTVTPCQWAPAPQDPCKTPQEPQASAAAEEPPLYLHVVVQYLQPGGVFTPLRAPTLQGHRQIPQTGEPCPAPKPCHDPTVRRRAELGPPVLGVPSPAPPRNSGEILSQQSEGALGGFKEGDEP